MRKKRNVGTIETFCGWDYLLDMVRRCDNMRDRALISTLFETGGRVSEVLMLERRHFKISDDFLVVIAMPVVKRYKKVDKYYDEKAKKWRWITEKALGYRSFPIRLDEKLVPYVLEWLDYIGDGLLFPSSVSPQKPLSRIHAWRIVTRINPDVFPHWFRAQRASQLALEYGFDVHDLIEFFSWKDLRTAIHYSHMGWKGLAAKMSPKNK